MIKKGYFINCISMPEEEIKSSGVMKKVYSQIEVLRKYFDVEHILVNTYGKSNNTIDKIIRRLPFTPIDNNWKYEDKYKDADFIYFRKSDIDYTVYKFFKDIKKNNKNTKILFEIPTYPYDKENFYGVKDLPLLLKDKMNSRKFIKYVDRVITYSNDSHIYGIKTIETKNGFNFSKTKLRNINSVSNDINVISVASFSPAHGIDRLLIGLSEYYKTDGKRRILLHLVGGGSCIEEYKQIVKKNSIERNVVFYGWKSGKELDDIYDKVDIGIEILAGYRKEYFLSSSLKSREYASKGLPIVTSCKIDYLNDDYPYQLVVPNDDTPIDINAIIDFYDSIYINGCENKEIISNSIRKKAIDNCDMNITLKPVINYIKNV